MPERIRALFAYSDDNAERFQRMFLAAGMIDRLVALPPPQGLYVIDLASEEVAQRLVLAAYANGLEAPQIQRYLQPDAQELASSPLLVMSAGGPGNDRPHPRAGTDYDDRSACAQCGSGVRQTSPLVLRKTELPKSFNVAGVADDIIVHDAIATAIQMRFPELSTRAVSMRGGPQLPWQQLLIEAQMPPMLAATRGVMRGRAGAERPCPVCQRDGWFDTTADPFLPAYSRAALDAMPAAAWMYELFGTGAWREPMHGKRWLARRRLIVRQDFYQLLKSLKVRGARFSVVAVQ